MALSSPNYPSFTERRCRRQYWSPMGKMACKIRTLQFRNENELSYTIVLLSYYALQTSETTTTAIEKLNECFPSTTKCTILDKQLRKRERLTVITSVENDSVNKVKTIGRDWQRFFSVTWGANVHSREDKEGMRTSSRKCDSCGAYTSHKNPIKTRVEREEKPATLVRV